MAKHQYFWHVFGKFLAFSLKYNQNDPHKKGWILVPLSTLNSSGKGTMTSAMKNIQAGLPRSISDRDSFCVWGWGLYAISQHGKDVNLPFGFLLLDINSS